MSSILFTYYKRAVVLCAPTLDGMPRRAGKGSEWLLTCTLKLIQLEVHAGSSSTSRLSVNTLNIFIGEDYPIVRSGMKALLEGRYEKVTVFESALDVRGILEAIGKIPKLDLAILGINRGVAISTSYILEIKKELPQIRILVLAPATNMTYARLFFKHGINGYIGKHSPEDELLSAMNTVLRGNRYLDWNIFERSLYTKTEKNPFDALSVSELRVTQFLFEGYNYEKIAAMIKINIRTVQLYKHQLFKKLNVKNTIQLVSLGEKFGLLDN